MFAFPGGGKCVKAADSPSQTENEQNPEQEIYFINSLPQFTIRCPSSTIVDKAKGEYIRFSNILIMLKALRWAFRVYDSELTQESDCFTSQDITRAGKLQSQFSSIIFYS